MKVAHFGKFYGEIMPLCGNVPVTGRGNALYTNRYKNVTCKLCQKVIKSKVKNAKKIISAWG